MRFSEVTGMLKGYFLFACLGVILLIALFCIGYFLFYKRLIKGKSELTIGKAIILLMLIGYLLMVLSATFFSRGENYPNAVNIHFFSSYIEAWNSWRLRSWQLLLFNIALFVPLGALLPLAFKKFEKFLWTISAGFLFTLFIESVQLFFGIGVFEFDDIFNNLLGTIIGYCIVMTFLTIVRSGRSKTKKVIYYVLPILIVICGFAGIYIKYNLQEFGNLALAYNYKVNYTDADIQINTVLSDEPEDAMVYRTAVYDKDSGLQYAKQIFDRFGISADEIRITQYNDNAIYNTVGTESYSLWIYYKGGTYSFTDFSGFDSEPGDTAIEEAEARELLQRMNIYIPEDAEFTADGRKGAFSFSADLVKEGDYYYTGEVDCDIDKGNSIKNISNQLISLQEYRSVEIKSESEALEEVRQGKFRMYMEGEQIDTMLITDVTLDYALDSKGYYQPLYKFDATINGKKNTISIPAMK